MLFHELIYIISIDIFTAQRITQHISLNISVDYNTWGVQVVRYPNFFSREWKQIET